MCFIYCAASSLNHFAILLLISFGKLIKLLFIAFTTITTHVLERAPRNYIYVLIKWRPVRSSLVFDVWCLPMLPIDIQFISIFQWIFSQLVFLSHFFFSFIESLPVLNFIRFQFVVLKNSGATTFNEEIKLILQLLSTQCRCQVNSTFLSFVLYGFSLVSSFLSRFSIFTEYSFRCCFSFSFFWPYSLVCRSLFGSLASRILEDNRFDFRLFFRHFLICFSIHTNISSGSMFLLICRLSIILYFLGKFRLAQQFKERKRENKCS